MKSSKTFIAKIAGIMALALALIAAGLFLITRDDSPASKLLRQGNDAFAQQAYLDALGAYELAQARQPELAEPFYNAANALYREGNFGDAIVQIQQALLNVADEELAQNSFYNMGNAAYNGQDLETAVQSYIDALLINPNDTDAKYNLELALQQQQQQEQEQQQQENQDQQEQDQENQDQQSEDSQDGEQNQDQQESNSENGDKPQDSENGQGDQPSDQSQDGQGEQSDQQQDEQSDKDPSQDGEGQPNDQEQSQQNPSNGQPQPGDPNDPNQNGMVPQPGERMTKEQAQQLLMSIAQGSGTLQERLQQIYVSPLPPSAQDW